MKFSKKSPKIIALYIILTIITTFIFVYASSPLVRLSTKIAFHMLTYSPDFSFIEKVYIINLDGQAQRYQNTIKVLSQLEIPASYKRFPAINGRKVRLIGNDSVMILGDVLTNIESVHGTFNLDYDGELKDSFITLNGRSCDIRFPGEIGCYCSHREVWNDILKNGYKRVLVLEDDVCFRRQSRGILDLALKNIPEPYDFLYLKAIIHEENTVDQSTKHLCFRKILKHTSSLEAYIMTDRAAEVLLAHTNDYTKPIDILVSDVIEKHLITAYSTYPQISRQVGPSITSSGKLD